MNHLMIATDQEWEKVSNDDESVSGVVSRSAYNIAVQVNEMADDGGDGMSHSLANFPVLLLRSPDQGLLMSPVFSPRGLLISPRLPLYFGIDTELVPQISAAAREETR